MTRGKHFNIRNDIVWLMLLDTRDALVIHLASWAKAQYQPGGLFGQVRAHHIPDLRRARRRDDAERDARLATLLDDAHSAAFDRLFPDAQKAKSGARDVDSLKDRFEARVAHVLADRDANRAHPFERGHGNIAMLDIPDLGDAFAYAEQLLNDLRLVACASTMPATELNLVSSRAVADDLVDMVLGGTMFMLTSRREGRRRDALYYEAHARHDAVAGAGLFNDFFLR